MKIKIRFFTLFALTALITASFGTVFAQGPLPPTNKNAWSLPKHTVSGLQMKGRTDSPNFKMEEAQATAYDAIRNGDFEQGRGVEWGEY